MRRRQGREGRQAHTPALFQRSQTHYPRSVPSQQPRQDPPVPENRKKSRKRRGSPRSKEPGSPRQGNPPSEKDPPLPPPNPRPGTGTPARRKRPGTIPPPSAGGPRRAGRKTGPYQGGGERTFPRRFPPNGTAHPRTIED